MATTRKTSPAKTAKKVVEERIERIEALHAASRRFAELSRRQIGTPHRAAERRAAALLRLVAQLYAQGTYGPEIADAWLDAAKITLAKLS